MSVDITFEIESGVSREDLLSVFCNVDFDLCDADLSRSAMIGSFVRSGMPVFYRDVLMVDWDKNDEPLTSDVRASGWRIAARLSMKYRYSLSEACDEDIRALIEAMEKISSVRFLVAYDYEVLHAIKDGANVVICD